MIPALGRQRWWCRFAQRGRPHEHIHGVQAPSIDECTNPALANIVKAAAYKWEALRRQVLDIGREINPTVYSPAEFAKKRTMKDHFLMQVLTKPRLIVLGSADDLGKASRE